MKPLNVALVDDDDSVRKLVEAEFRRCEGRFRLSFYFDSPESAARLPFLKPDIVLVDILFQGGMSGVDFVWDIKPRLPQAGIIMITRSHSPNHILRALEGGADAYVLKKDIEEKLVRAIENVRSGAAELSPSIARKIIEHLRQKSRVEGRARDERPEGQ